mmetsp:Transcript_28126/g.56536  ORF Transcript_28126/g.56536 Transcript_28126/m.56536 type:complete len:579 (-) Transcript_28126:165-1901(-)
MMTQKAEDSNPNPNSPAVAVAAAMTCNETDALLQVKYTITEAEWKSTRSFSPTVADGRFTPFLLSMGSARTPYHKYQYNPTYSSDYAACLPRDKCSEVVVGGLPTDGYKLSFDGKVIDIGQAFPFDGKNPVTSTEVGSCTNTKPICEDKEALLEIQDWNNEDEFRVEDKDGNTVLNSSNNPKSYSVNNTYSCLPKDDACYTFLIGGKYQWDTSSFPPSSYSVFFDGKLVRRSDSWLFDSVQFGDSCKPRCNPDDESLVEFFMYDSNDFYSEEKYEYAWDLSVVDHNSSVSASVASGVVSQGPGISQLAHRLMCIPKGSCSSFYISAPHLMERVKLGNETVNHTISLHPVYTLAMDNVTYRKVDWRAPETYGSDSQTTNMGSCTVGGLCNEQTQDLFDLQFRTPVEYQEPSIPNSSLPMIGTDNIRWEFWEDFGLYSKLEDYNYNSKGYNLDSTYGVIECVPKRGCDMSFKIATDSPVERYEVEKNGIQMNDTEVVSGLLYGHRYHEEVKSFDTPFGQNCNSPSPSPESVSGGAIAGIVIACAVAVGVIVFGSIWYKRRQNQSSKDGKGEEGELRENLL